MSQLRRKEKNSCFAKAEKTGRTVACYAAAPALFRSAGEGKQGSAALRRRENDFRKRECRKRKGTRGDECLFRIHFSLGSEDRSGMYSITSQTPQCRIWQKIVDLCRADAIAAPHARKCCRADAVFVDERVSRDPLLFQCAPKRRIADHNSVASFRKRWFFQVSPKTDCYAQYKI